MEHTTDENALNEDLREIQGMVRKVKKDPEVTAGYMIRYLKMVEELNKMRAEGKAEGRAEGKVEGKAEGRIEGKLEGKIEGKIEGELFNKVSLICKKLRKGKALEKIAEELEEEISAIEPIYNMAKEFAPDYDLELVFKQVREEHLQL